MTSGRVSSCAGIPSNEDTFHKCDKSEVHQLFVRINIFYNVC